LRTALFNKLTLLKERIAKEPSSTQAAIAVKAEEFLGSAAAAVVNQPVFGSLDRVIAVPPVLRQMMDLDGSRNVVPSSTFMEDRSTGRKRSTTAKDSEEAEEDLDADVRLFPLFFFYSSALD
jgi:hypothetical protein